MKLLFFFLFYIISLNNLKSQDNMKVIYVYDALCGWCYGFSEVMNQFSEKYKNTTDFEVISGGMITGNRIGPIGEVAPYISWAYKDVEKATGVKFGEKFLNETLKDGKAIFTSIPPAIAMSVFKTLMPDESIKFASKLQKAIYYDGIEPEKLEAYSAIAKSFGANEQQFLEAMKDTSNLKLAQNDFQKSKELGVKGFPSVFVLANGTYHKISSGYVSLKVLETSFLAVKSKLK